MLRLPFLFLRQTLNLGYTHIMIKIDQMDRLVGVFLIVAAALAILILGETMSLSKILGACMIIFAVIILGKKLSKASFL